MLVFYRGPEARITDEAFESITTQQRYLIHELKYVHQVRGSSWRTRTRPQELRAIHKGQLVCLYRTTNRRTFGQVSRALLRALEQLEDGRR
jgi:hypothetical protein